MERIPSNSKLLHMITDQAAVFPLVMTTVSDLKTLWEKNLWALMNLGQSPNQAIAFPQSK